MARACQPPLIADIVTARRSAIGRHLQVLTIYFEGTTPFHSMAAAITHTDGLAFPAENQVRTVGAVV